jgi:hypothetical protein
MALEPPVPCVRFDGVPDAEHATTTPSAKRLRRLERISRKLSVDSVMVASLERLDDLAIRRLAAACAYARDRERRGAATRSTEAKRR